jgi:hypothetical protein
MQFFQPHFLWGLLGLAIPLLIHLFNFQRTERVIFSNNRLLEEVNMQTQKARQVKNWLLLFCRMMALALLVLAFAQPVFTSNSGSNQNKGMVQSIVYFDDSQSMFIGKDGIAPFDQGQEAIKKWPEKFSGKGWYQLLSNGFRFRPWTSAKGFSEQVAEINQPETGRDFKSVLGRIHRQMKSQNLGEQKKILLVSDFQKSALGELQNLEWDSSLAYQILAVEHSEKKNFWIDSVWLPKPVDNQSKSQMIKVKLASSGNVADSKINLQLFANGSLISGKIVSPGNQNPFIAELPFRIKPNEVLACTLSTDDSDISFDNAFYFKIQSPRPAKVCLLTSKPNTFLNQAFSDKKLFRYAVSDYLNPNYQLIKDADLVIVNQAGSMENALSSLLNKNLKEGKSLLFISGKAAPSFLKNNFSLDLEANTLNQKPEDWKILLPGKENPFFANAFREISSSSLRPFARPNQFLKNGVALLKFENGSPYLSKISQEKGQLFWLSAPLENEESNVQKHPLVIPMLFKMALSVHESASGSLFSRVSDNTFFLQADSTILVKEQVVALESGSQSFKTSLSKNGDLLKIELPAEAMKPGFYQVKSENSLLGVFALNSRKEESVFYFYSAEELTKIFENKPFIKVEGIKSGTSSAHAAQSAQDSIPLWKYFIVAALVFLLLEMWLARQNLLKQSKAA